MLVLDNPYPCACYNEHDFNGLVLKCLFNGLPLNRIVGLDRRTNPALAGLCEDYRDERVLANRNVPADIWLALVPYASPRGLALAVDALGAEDPRVRLHAARVLSARRGEPAVQDALEARRQAETDTAISAILASGRASPPRPE
jgi:hypothetical protein